MRAKRPSADTNKQTMRVTATNLGVRQALKDAVALVADMGVAAADLANVELVLGEVLNNIVEHALPNVPGAGFELAIFHRPGQLCFATTDQGRPMPGGEIPASDLPRTDVAIHDMPEGGFGWPLFLMLADDILYTRQDGTNTLEFRLPVCV